MWPRFKAFFQNSWFCWLALAALTATLFRPLFFQAARPGTDQSVFIYGGWRLSQGEMPYLDFWDHKGPLIYALNALPFAPGNDVSQGAVLSGIVWLEMLGMLVAMGSLFWLLRAHLGIRAALMGLCGLVAAFRWPVGDGNYVEEWAFYFNSLLIALAFAPIFLRHDRLTSRRAALGKAVRAAAIGVLMALTLLLRPNEAGVGAAVLLFWLLAYRFEVRARSLWLGFALGLAFPLAVCGFWLQRGGAWPDFLDQYLVFNRLYSHASFQDRWESVIKGVVRLGTRGTFVIAFCGFVLLLLRWRELAPARRESEFSPETRLFLRFSALLFPLQIVLSCLSGRAYPHYYIAWWLPCVLLCAYTLRNVRFTRGANFSGANFSSRAKPVFALILLLFAATEWSKSALGSLRARRDASPDVVAFVTARTRPDESFLIWGNAVALHLHARRRGASRFVYQNAIALGKGSSQTRYLNQFAREIEASRPSVVIDTSQEYDFKKRRSNIEFPLGLRDVPVLRFWIDKNYRLTKRSEQNWLLYERKN